MSKLNIAPLARLLSSTKIIDEGMNISSFINRWKNKRLNK
jgi:hypothetical protein